MTVELALTRLHGSPDATRLLVVGPSLGTSVSTLWSACASRMPAELEVVGWDLPGHGASAPATGPFTVGDLAYAVRKALTPVAAGRPSAYAGVSLGGCVAFALATDPGPFDTLVAIASSPRIGEPGAWSERAGLVRRAGTPVMVSGSAQRWFAPGFTVRDPSTASALLLGLSEADSASYAWACEALGGFDARADVAGALVPLHVVTGEHDPVVPPDSVADLLVASRRVLMGCAHLPPAEVPDATADLLTDILEPTEARP